MKDGVVSLVFASYDLGCGGRKSSRGSDRLCCLHPQKLPALGPSCWIQAGGRGRTHLGHVVSKCTVGGHPVECLVVADTVGHGIAVYAITIVVDF